MFSFAPILGLGLNLVTGSQIPTLQKMYEEMGQYGVNLNRMARGLPFSPQQLVGGVFDPSTFVEGLGLAASSIPSHPGLEAFQQLAALQQQHQQELAAYRREQEGRLEDLKEQVFRENHYEIDEEGELVLGEDGRPVLAEGAETGEQRRARLAWERRRREQLIARHEAEAAAFRREADGLLQAWISRGGPGSFQEYQARTEDLARREQEMNLRHYRELLLDPLRGLPDPERPGELLDNRVEEAFQGSFALRRRQEQIEQTTPAGSAIAAYMAQMNSFLQDQHRRLAALREDEFDPDAMRNLRHRLS